MFLRHYNITSRQAKSDNFEKFCYITSQYLSHIPHRNHAVFVYITSSTATIGTVTETSGVSLSHFSIGRIMTENIGSRLTAVPTLFTVTCSLQRNEAGFLQLA